MSEMMKKADLGPYKEGKKAYTALRTQLSSFIQESKFNKCTAFSKLWKPHEHNSIVKNKKRLKP